MAALGLIPLKLYQFIGLIWFNDLEIFYFNTHIKICNIHLTIFSEIGIRLTFLFSLTFDQSSFFK